MIYIALKYYIFNLLQKYSQIIMPSFVIFAYLLVSLIIVFTLKLPSSYRLRYLAILSEESLKMPNTKCPRNGVNVERERARGGGKVLRKTCCLLSYIKQFQLVCAFWVFGISRSSLSLLFGPFCEFFFNAKRAIFVDICKFLSQTRTK